MTTLVDRNRSISLLFDKTDEKYSANDKRWIIISWISPLVMIYNFNIHASRYEIPTGANRPFPPRPPLTTNTAGNEKKKKFSSDRNSPQNVFCGYDSTCLAVLLHNILYARLNKQRIAIRSEFMTDRRLIILIIYVCGHPGLVLITVLF